MKALILSSGGIDSTTCIAKAIEDLGKENVITVSILYGQKHSKELESAKLIAEYYGVEHYTLNLTDIFKDNKSCSLLNSSDKEVKKSSYEEQLKETKILDTYVPFRNGLFLASVTSYIMGLYPDEEITIYLGIHQEDSRVAYPDCSPEFNKAISDAIYYGSGRQVRVKSPFLYKEKKDIVKYGLENNVPYYLTWSCYSPTPEGKRCMECATDLDCIKAFKENGKDYKELFS